MDSKDIYSSLANGFGIPALLISANLPLYSCRHKHPVLPFASFLSKLHAAIGAAENTVSPTLEAFTNGLSDTLPTYGADADSGEETLNNSTTSSTI